MDANSLGLFPFKSVGLGKLEDGHGQCLWYAVSGSYKNSPDLDMINWDSTGMLNVEDEAAALKHSPVPADFPIAVIIAPGAVLSGQDRTPDTALPLCGGNYDRNNYLEGGTSLDYSTYTSDDVGSIWSFLDASFSSGLGNGSANDQIVFITRKELWDRVKQTRVLDTAAASSPIKELASQLAECLVYYGDEGLADRNLIFGGRLVLPDYQDRDEYRDRVDRLYGRFPQDIRASNHATTPLKISHADEKRFVVSSSGNGYCETKTGLDPVLWENWKDQFFVVVAKDFEPGSALPYSNRCTAFPGSNCLKINGKTNVAAIVFFARERSNDQVRDLTAFADDNSLSDRSGLWNEYLDAGNRHLYDGSPSTDDFVLDPGDYSICILKNPAGLSVEAC
jgi:hypothetical protein